MSEEILRVKRYLAERYQLPLEGQGYNVRVVGHVPDSHHIIALGHKKIPHHVEIKGGMIHIGDDVSKVQCYHCEEWGAMNWTRGASDMPMFTACQACWDKFLDDVANQYGILRI